MPVKNKKKKAGHFMSYFRHKLLYLKDAWKKRKKKTGHFMSYFRHNLLYLKDAWKKKEKSRPLYVIFQT